MKRAVSLSIFVISIFAASAFADTLTEARNHFNNREGNQTEIKQARKLYERLLQSPDSATKLEAAEMLGRLAYYDGDLLTPDNNSRKRKNIFSKCLKYMDSIDPSKGFEENEPFYYWKTLCLAQWAKAAGVWGGALGVLGEMKDTMNRGIERFNDYEGGGIYRVVAAIYVRSKIMMLAGLYKPEKALELIEKAIAKGPDFFTAYLIKAEVLVELGRTQDARSLLEDKKADLEYKLAAGEIAQFLTAESKVILRKMVDLMTEL